MKPSHSRTAILLTFAIVLSGTEHAAADDGEDSHDDHERAHWARKHGRARPLAEILGRVRSQLGGDVVGIDFKEQRGRYLYEFKVVAPSGRLREVHVDANTAEILEGEDD